MTIRTEDRGAWPVRIAVSAEVAQELYSGGRVDYDDFAIPARWVLTLDDAGVAAMIRDYTKTQMREVGRWIGHGSGRASGWSALRRRLDRVIAVICARCQGPLDDYAWELHDVYCQPCRREADVAYRESLAAGTNTKEDHP